MAKKISKSSSRKSGAGRFPGVKKFFLLTVAAVMAAAGWWVLFRYPAGITFRVQAFDCCCRLYERGRALFTSCRTVGDSPGKKEKTPQDDTRISRSGSPVRPVGKSSYRHLELGIPGPSDCLIRRDGYALGYINCHRQAAWVSYRLTDAQLNGVKIERENDFREDPEVRNGSSTAADYRASGYDRGHLAPAADMSYSVNTMSDSFYLSNISPQRPECNRGIWKDVEAQVRYFAKNEKDIYIVTGPIFSSGKNISIGKNRVTVPDFYYKVVYDATPPEKMIAFIVPNCGSNLKPRDFAVTVREVEEQTGLDFFSELPDEVEKELETTLEVKRWKWLK